MATRPTSAPEPGSAEALFLERLRSRPWQVLDTGPATGPMNMALDLALLQTAAAPESGMAPTLRFYQWSPPAVSLGRFQDVRSVDLEYARSQGWSVVRRATGGRAVLHQHELTYSLILPPDVVGGIGVRGSYSVLIGALNAGLRSLLPVETAVATPAPGCDARSNRAANCFALSSECDSLTDLGKLVGSAQVRQSGALLQHGSILLELEPEAWSALFGEAGRGVSLHQLLGAVPDPEAVREAVAGGFSALGVRLEAAALPAELPASAEALLTAGTVQVL